MSAISSSPSSAANEAAEASKRTDCSQTKQQSSKDIPEAGSTALSPAIEPASLHEGPQPTAQQAKKIVCQTLHENLSHTTTKHNLQLPTCGTGKPRSPHHESGVTNPRNRSQTEGDRRAAEVSKAFLPSNNFFATHLSFSHLLNRKIPLPPPHCLLPLHWSLPSFHL